MHAHTQPQNTCTNLEDNNNNNRVICLDVIINSVFNYINQCKNWFMGGTSLSNELVRGQRKTEGEKERVKWRVGVDGEDWSGWGRYMWLHTRS